MRGSRVFWTLILVFCLLGQAAGARGDTEAEFDLPPVHVDLPLLTTPYNDQAQNWPSMTQSTRLSASFYQVSHSLLTEWLDPYRGGWNGFGARLAIAFADGLSVYFPFGNGWQHEEFHRAVLGYRGISSFNEVYNVPLGAGVIKVSRVRDQQLIELKRDYPADMVRLAAAGVEGGQELMRQLQSYSFFYDNRAYHDILYWFETLNSWFYLQSGTSDEFDETTQELNKEESEQLERDFVGHDFLSWVYDLHRPDEPYELRGTHVSGEGIDRYRLYTDLSDEERDYMRQMKNLGLLNFVDPFLIGWRGWETTNPQQLRVTSQLRHTLTSFGYAITLRTFARVGKANWVAEAIGYRNHERWFFGASMDTLRWRPRGWSSSLTLGGRVWEQPRDQLFRQTSGKYGGAVQARWHWPVWRGIDSYIEGQYKSGGWLAGWESLDEATQLLVGFDGFVF